MLITRACCDGRDFGFGLHNSHTCAWEHPEATGNWSSSKQRMCETASYKELSKRNTCKRTAFAVYQNKLGCTGRHQAIVCVESLQWDWLAQLCHLISLRSGASATQPITALTCKSVPLRAVFCPSVCCVVLSANLV